MEIEIYQINTDRDKDDLCFMNTDFLKRKNITEIPAKIYDKVFAGTVNCQTLEDVYRKFNIEHPFGYTSRSLSVSDIVRVKRSEPSVKKGCYFCDSIGFKRVDFRYALAKDAKKQQKKVVAKALGISLRQLRARQYNLGQLQELERGAVRGLDIRTYADPAFSSQQMYQIRCDMKNHKDVSAYAKPVYDTDQMLEIRDGVENGLDVSRYADHQYDGYQMREIREGMEHGVDVSIYADLKYDNGQMKAIRQGLESGVDVSQYADPKFNMWQMEMLLRGLQNGLDVSRIADPAISAADMSETVERMMEQPLVQEQHNKAPQNKSLQEIVSSAKEYAQKNPEKLAQKNSPPSRGKVL